MNDKRTKQQQEQQQQPLSCSSRAKEFWFDVSEFHIAEKFKLSVCKGKTRKGITRVRDSHKKNNNVMDQ